MTRAAATDDSASGPFHAGELAVQTRAGVRAEATRVGGIIGPTIPPPFAAFLRTARVVAIGAADAREHVWATLVVGAPGFVAASPTRVRVGAVPAPGDALRTLLTEVDPGGPRVPSSVGLTIIDLATRRRVRVNGTLAAADPGDARPGVARGFAVAVDEAYGNCPKYIQARTAPDGDVPNMAPDVVADDRSGEPPDGTHEAPDRDGLSAAQRAWLAGADTAFMASVGPPHDGRAGRADASHRGGAAGFLVALDAHHVLLPDYAGNTMFNTLGNLTVDPRVGLAVPDFASGRLLQLSGTASIDWRPDVAARVPGAERVVLVAVERVREVAGALPARWSSPRPSPFNPPVRTEPQTLRLDAPPR